MNNAMIIYNKVGTVGSTAIKQCTISSEELVCMWLVKKPFTYKHIATI
jgi:hypothetical protein